MCEQKARNKFQIRTYIAQKSVYGRLFIRKHHYALGPFIILKYLDKKMRPLPLNKVTYEVAKKKQLDIIHYCNIIQGDINPRNILYSDGKINFIDFGYSKHTDNKLGSNPVSANPKRARVTIEAM